MKVKVSAAIGTVPKGLEKEFEIRGIIDTTQIIALLR